MQQYLDLLQDILDNGESHDDRTGVGTLSVFGRQIRFNLRKGFPLMTTKKLPFRWIAEELFWFLSGSTDVADLQTRGVKIWDEWATEAQCEKFNRQTGQLGPVYGHTWRNFDASARSQQHSTYGGKAFIDHAGGNRRKINVGYNDDGHDQIAALMNDISSSPNSRRLIVTGWHPVEQSEVALPPCHTLWQVKCHAATREVSLHLYARSIDSFLGLPFNIASYALLLKLIGHSANYTPRDLVISFGDVHIYKNHVDQVREQLSREPRYLSGLCFDTTDSKNLWDYRFEDVYLVNYNPYPSIKAPVAV